MVREVLDTGRTMTRFERVLLVEAVATAPFNPNVVTVRLEHQGSRYLDVELGTHAASLTYHLFQRVILEGQWASGTTEQLYLDDLRRSVRYPFGRVAVYERRGGMIVSFVAPTEYAVRFDSRGTNWEPQLVVVYSVDRGIIVTGYQFSTLDKVAIPETARWQP
jgi:hypothetical protein